MNKVEVRVLFEDPFWIGIIDRTSENHLSVSKVTFGAEPKDYEVYEFIRNEYYNLKFTQAIEVLAETKKRINPKRRDREVRKSMQDLSVGTKSQQALKLEHEKGKVERKKNLKKKNEEELERRFELKQQKRKAKHKGR